MKKIICLYGSANKGKTHTLNMLVGILDPIQTINIKKLGENQQKVVEYNGHRIAITSAGDSRHELEKNIKFCQKNECDILITATRTRGGSTEEVHKFSQEVSCKITWLRKNEAIELKNLINESQAKDIQAILDKL